MQSSSGGPNPANGQHIMTAWVNQILSSIFLYFKPTFHLEESIFFPRRCSLDMLKDAGSVPTLKPHGLVLYYE